MPFTPTTKMEPASSQAFAEDFSWLRSTLTAVLTTAGDSAAAAGSEAPVSAGRSEQSFGTQTLLCCLTTGLYLSERIRRPAKMSSTSEPARTSFCRLGGGAGTGEPRSHAFAGAFRRAGKPPGVARLSVKRGSSWSR